MSTTFDIVRAFEVPLWGSPFLHGDKTAVAEYVNQHWPKAIAIRVLSMHDSGATRRYRVLLTLRYEMQPETLDWSEVEDDP